MTWTHLAVGTDDEPTVECRSDANLVVITLDANTTVSMKPAQWERLRAQGGTS